MAEQTVTETKEYKVKESAPTDLDKTMDAILDAGSEADPEPKTETTTPTESVETAPPTETESTENPTPPASEPVAEATPKAKAEHPLTPEEEHLLRRNDSSEDDLAFYRSLDVEQRNKALKPLRAAQKAKDRFWGLPKEERTRLAQDSSVQDGIPTAPDPTEASLTESLKVKTELLREIAEKEGISVENLKKITDQLAAQTAATITPIVRQLDDRRKQDSQSESDRAITESRTELVKSFPQIKDEKIWTEILNDPDVLDLAMAKQRRTGSITAGVKHALDWAVKRKFFEQIQTQATQRRAASATQALKSTAERTGSGRGSLDKRPPPKTLDEAMDRVFSEAEEA